MPTDSRDFASSNIAAGSYDDEKLELTIHFNNGGIYKYSNVPVDIWHGLTQASSVGSYFHHNVKNAGFAYERLS